MPRQIFCALIAMPAPGLLVLSSLTRPVLRPGRPGWAGTVRSFSNRSTSPVLPSGDDAGLDLTTAAR